MRAPKRPIVILPAKAINARFIFQSRTGTLIAMSPLHAVLGISNLADKVELYARFNESTDQWVDYLGTGADADNLLYPMRLDDLP